MASSGMLVVVKGYNKGDVYKLGARNLTAGRDTGNLIQLIDREVSRRHCLIRKTSDGYRIVDMNSANGTYVNGDLVREMNLVFGDTIKVGGTYLQLIESMADVPDAAMGGKVTDRRIAAAPTVYGDNTDWDAPLETPMPTPGPAPMPRPAEITPGGTAIPRPSSNTPIATPAPQMRTSSIIDTVQLHNERTSEMATIFEQMRIKPDYLDVATHTLSRFICPDRAVILKIQDGKRLGSLKVYLHPNLDRENHQVPPALSVVKQAMKSRQVALENKIVAPPGQRLAASALVVPVLSPTSALGAVYVDCFPRSRKIFMDFDSELLERIAEVLSERWQ